MPVFWRYIFDVIMQYIMEMNFKSIEPAVDTERFQVISLYVERLVGDHLSLRKRPRPLSPIKF